MASIIHFKFDVGFEHFTFCSHFYVKTIDNTHNFLFNNLPFFKIILILQHLIEHFLFQHS
jgi:hypothetical protein